MEKEISNNFQYIYNGNLNNNNYFNDKNNKLKEFNDFSLSIPPFSPFSSTNNHIPFQQKNNLSIIPIKYIPSIYKNFKNNDNNISNDKIYNLKYSFNNNNNNNNYYNDLKIQEKIQYDLSVEKIKVLEKTLISLDEMIENLKKQTLQLKGEQLQIQEKEDNLKIEKSKSKISCYVKKMKPFEENKISQCFWKDCKDNKKFFDNIIELGEHIDEHVNTLNMNQLKCKWKDCQASNNTFYNKYSLINHIRYRHTGIKPFICRDNNCSKAFVRKADLDSHESSHQKRNSSQKSNGQLFEIKIN
ncbi:hypothetical protein ACTFIU_000769 [Dictyostelium citrinum]